MSKTRAHELYAEDVLFRRDLPQEMPEMSMVSISYDHGGHILWNIHATGSERVHEYNGSKHEMCFDALGNLTEAYTNGVLTGVWVAGIKVV